MQLDNSLNVGKSNFSSDSQTPAFRLTKVQSTWVIKQGQPEIILQIPWEYAALRLIVVVKKVDVGRLLKCLESRVKGKEQQKQMHRGSGRLSLMPEVQISGSHFLSCSILRSVKVIVLHSTSPISHHITSPSQSTQGNNSHTPHALCQRVTATIRYWWTSRTWPTME